MRVLQYLYHIIVLSRAFNDILYILAEDYEVPRGRIVLSEILGEGQFGDVHQGIFKDRVSESTNLSPCIICVCFMYFPPFYLIKPYSETFYRYVR